MDCSEVKDLLSSYYDDELPADTRAAVAEHVAGCEECARELEDFSGLSTMAKALTHPESPARIWQQLEEQLHSEDRAKAKRPTLLDWLRETRKPVMQLGLASAAAILVAIAWLGYGTWYKHRGHAELAVVFGQYLDEFYKDPRAAQQILLAKYEGQAVDVEQAVHAVGYRPVVADGLPDGYTVESTYVMKMPCCTCVKCLCNRGDGTTIAIFEHDDEEADWFGDRREAEAICAGIECSIVALDDRFAVTWRHGERHITVVGVQDTAEVDRLVAWFDDRRQSVPR